MQFAPILESYMALTLEEVQKVAHLARLELSEAEVVQYQQQLSAVLDYVESIQELDLADVVPTTRAVPMQNVMRDDRVVPSLPLEEVLFNAPQQKEEQFQIQAVAVWSEA